MISTPTDASGKGVRFFIAFKAPNHRKIFSQITEKFAK